ncbi:MAG: glycosyltransferase [Acidimicrobiales bacterium]|nr:glycosyltransferase [Acidimicrobiales bacterium]
MKIALFGPFMFELAVGLRQNEDNEVRLFLDSRTIPTGLRDEPLLNDPEFAAIAPWVGKREILRPADAEITQLLSRFDVAIVTDLGPIFAERSATPFVFFPGGWDITHIPFPIRSRSERTRGRADVVETVIAARQRRGVRAASSIWAPAFRPYVLAAERLGVELGGCLPQAIDTSLFTPEVNEVAQNESLLKVFHPARFMFEPHPFIIETGGWKRNDLLLEGFALAVGQGLDGHLALIEREGSPDEGQARRLIDDLGVGSRVEWMTTGTRSEFTWREVAQFYRACDVSSDDFGGWFGLAALEGAASGKPVLNYLEPEVMVSEYPDGHPFVQTEDAEQICAVLLQLADRDLRDEIGRASREWVLQHHERGVVARRCERMLADRGLA